jgi:hypothetical protein
MLVKNAKYVSKNIELNQELILQLKKQSWLSMTFIIQAGMEVFCGTCSVLVQ